LNCPKISIPGNRDEKVLVLIIFITKYFTMNVNEIATKGDLEVLKAELLQAINKISTGTVDMNKKWVKSKEVMKFLGISATSLQTLRINGTIPYTKLSGLHYYDMEDLQKIMDKNKKNVTSK
jgi:hypothetical protein